MSKMTKPTVDVVRFAESDVIVASGELMSITNLGNGKEATMEGDGIWAFGSVHDLYTNDFYNKPDYFISNMNDFLGTNFSSLSEIKVGSSDVQSLATSDMGESPANPGNPAYNGTWRWNGSRFTHYSQ